MPHKVSPISFPAASPPPESVPRSPSSSRLATQAVGNFLYRHGFLHPHLLAILASEHEGHSSKLCCGAPGEMGIFNSVANVLPADAFPIHRLGTVFPLLCLSCAVYAHLPFVVCSASCIDDVGDLLEVPGRMRKKFYKVRSLQAVDRFVICGAYIDCQSSHALTPHYNHS